MEDNASIDNTPALLQTPTSLDEISDKVHYVEPGII